MNTGDKSPENSDLVIILKKMKKEVVRILRSPVVIAAIITAITMIIIVIISDSDLSTIQGVVTDTNGNPVEGAVVEIDGLSVTTDVSGTYVIHGVSVGIKTITVRAPGVEVINRSIRIPKDDEIVIFDIILSLPLEPSLKITYPLEDYKVEIEQTVRGTSQNIPEDQKIWIVVFVHGDNFYPQHYPINVQANGDWISTAITCTEVSAGEEFDILVVLANKEAQDILNAYIEQCKNEKKWPGLERLPEGAKIFDRVIVTKMGARIITVPADRYWYNTGIKVKQGDRLEFKAEGTWWNGICTTNPDGNSNESCDQCPIPDGNFGELIGKVGDDGMPFRIGDYAIIVAIKDGTLWLAMNENTGPCKDGGEGSCYEDNSGSLQVTIKMLCTQHSMRHLSSIHVIISYFPANRQVRFS
jgi:hypothetical protein